MELIGKKVLDLCLHPSHSLVLLHCIPGVVKQPSSPKPENQGGCNITVVTGCCLQCPTIMYLETQDEGCGNLEPARIPSSIPASSPSLPALALKTRSVNKHNNR